MAKRHLDLRGAKAPKLELDFLRLAFVVRELQRRGEQAKGYLMVMTPSIERRVRSWIRRYETTGDVEVVIPTITPAERVKLEAEVSTNIEGMVAGTLGEDVAGRSDASAGAHLAEEKLRGAIEAALPGLRRITDASQFPLGILWDYYGVSDAGQALIEHPLASGGHNS